jgi:membrane peptidoglycan carboxypeptidase
LNTDFVYTPVDNGRKQRSVLVSAANPNYSTLDQISPYLQKCVLTTEDPSFFYHRGFIDEAFRQSIIKNIRKRKFARGASTISMQLVKNVFLTREKTISRKLEEILLVYILENNRISSKQRMLEVYFNIIEWGPNVYGIGEASQFYFQKQPSQLTFKECLFLATIIPRPKGFMWRFGKEGNLKPFAEKQFTFLTKLMLRRSIILPKDTLVQPIQITGPAKGFIKITADTIATDSILIDEDGRVSELIVE